MHDGQKKGFESGFKQIFSDGVPTDLYIHDQVYALGVYTLLDLQCKLLSIFEAETHSGNRLSPSDIVIYVFEMSATVSIEVMICISEIIELRDRVKFNSRARYVKIALEGQIGTQTVTALA